MTINPDRSRDRGPKDGPSCPGCGLPNYQGMCPHCRGDQDAYERELVPLFESSLVERDGSGHLPSHPAYDPQDGAL